jgi:tripartite-type tricarboxylate transporter receptor subunit TctC
MRIWRWLALAMVGVGLAAGSVAASAQEYPSRVITVVVPFAAGGPGDTIGRLLAKTMEAKLGQPIVIENVLGAGGTIGTARVAKASPDGYTLLLGHTGQATSVSLYRKLPYDPVEDFATIGLVTDVPMTLVGKPGFAPNTLQEAVALIRQQGDKIVFAHNGPGSVAHLCGLMFMRATKTKMTMVAYKGGGQVINDLIGGHIDFYCDPATGTTPYIQAKRIKAYAITGKTRLSTLPDLPTTAEAGFPGIAVTTWYGLYAPKGTPQPVVDKLVMALQAALADSFLIDWLTNQLSTAPVPRERPTPAAHLAHLKAEVASWATILKEAGVGPE